jgi:hypothetical protein
LTEGKRVDWFLHPQIAVMDLAYEDHAVLEDFFLNLLGTSPTPNRKEAPGHNMPHPRTLVTAGTAEPNTVRGVLALAAVLAGSLAR